jgi:hypothetical protein
MRGYDFRPSAKSIAFEVARVCVRHTVSAARVAEPVASCVRLKQKLDAANFNRLVRIAVLSRAGVAEIVVKGVRGK